MSMKRGTTLKQWQIDDAKRLKALFNKNAELSQLDFGSRYDIGSQGMVWQYLGGRAPLNIKVAVKFAVGLRCEVADFSPTLAQELATLADYRASTLSRQKHHALCEAPHLHEMTADEAAILQTYRGLCDEKKALLISIGNVIRASK